MLKVYAGTSTPGYKDGPVLEAQFEYPTLITTGQDNSLLIVDGDLAGRFAIINGGVRIRKIKNGIVSTFLNATASDHGVNYIRGITVDKDGWVFISEGNQIKKISPDGNQVIVVAGDGSMEIVKDGPALQATFWEPSGLAFDKNGCLYIMDTNNNSIRLLSNGKVSTLAGGNREFDPEGEDHFGPKDGIKLEAEFDRPQFITLDKQGNIYVCGGLFPILRKITPDGVVTTFLGVAGSFESEALDTFRGITLSDDGRFYINSNYARPIRSEYSFTVSSFALDGTQFARLASDDYPTGPGEVDPFTFPAATEDGLNFPCGMGVLNNTLFICNTGENRIRKIDLN